MYLPAGIDPGGGMIRPLIHQGDKRSSVEFPNLKVMGMWGVIGTPLDCQWIVPNLQSLYVFHDDITVTSKQQFLDTWDPNTNWGRVLVQRVLKEHPSLQEIMVCGPPDFDHPKSYGVMRRVLPPKPLAWDSVRLLAIASGSPQEEDCLIARLPICVFDIIPSFCHAPTWRVENVSMEQTK
jgi:hypothetical protein